MDKRSLYQCFHAKVCGDKIRCAMGYRLAGVAEVNIHRLRRGEPLEYAICQFCGDYDEMGPPIPPQERGWVRV